MAITMMGLPLNPARPWFGSTPLRPYDPRGAVQPMVQAALDQQAQAQPVVPPVASPVPYQQLAQAIMGGGAGNRIDRMAPNVPNRPLSDLPGFMGRVFGGPVAWAGYGPLARADIRNTHEQRGPGGGFGGSYGRGDRTSRGPGGSLGHI